MATNSPSTAAQSSEDDGITPRDSVSQCGSSSSSVSSRAQRAANRATARVTQALLSERHALKAKAEQSQRDVEAFEAKANVMLLDAEDKAINTVEAEEQGQAIHAPPKTPVTTALPSLVTTSAPVMPPPPPPADVFVTPTSAAAAKISMPQQQLLNQSGIKFVSDCYVESDMAAASGAIPKRPPPGLQAPPTYITSAQDIAMAPSAFQAGVGSYDAGTAVMDTVLPGQRSQAGCLYQRLPQDISMDI